MTKVSIRYNPYLVKTSVEIDGGQVTAQSRLHSIFTGKRLQDWIDPFLAILPEVVGNHDFDITFHGTRLDAEDLCESVEAVRGVVDYKLNLSAVVDTTAESRITELKKLFEQAKTGPFKELMRSIEERFYDALNPDFELTVLATMSAGKSTLINALLGSDLMPAKNEACTATIARITDSDDMEGFIARREDGGGKELDGWVAADKELVGQWNSDEATSLIEVKGNIPAINQGENVRLVLVDTPGPNNSRNANHAETTMKAITSKPLSMVLYLLNSTQIGTEDDQRILRKISETLASDGHQIHDRFVFVVNKMDTFDPGEGETPQRAIEQIKSYLSSNGIVNPIVIPISAQLAKLIRIKRAFGEDGFTRKQRNDLTNSVDMFCHEPEMNFLELCEEQIGSVCRKRLKEQLEQASTDEDKAELLSGVPILEALLQRFLHKYALPMKIKMAVSSLDKLMREADQIKAVTNALDQDEQALSRIEEQIGQIQQDKVLADQAKNFRNKIKKQKYTPSKEVKVLSDGLSTNFEAFLDDKKGLFGKKLKTKDAEKIIADIQREADRIAGEFEEESAKVLQQDFVRRLKSYRDEYQHNVKEFLNKSFPEDTCCDMGAVYDEILKLPPAEEFVLSQMKEVRILWLFKKSVVDSDSIWQAIETEARNGIKNTISSIQDLAQQGAAEARKVVLESMDEIDLKVTEVVNGLKSAIKDKKLREKKLAANREKLAWVEEMRAGLETILSISNEEQIDE
jgi:GTPase Era involved in 16S rRNA processing